MGGREDGGGEKEGDGRRGGGEGGGGKRVMRMSLTLHNNLKVLLASCVVVALVLMAFGADGRCALVLFGVCLFAGASLSLLSCVVRLFCIIIGVDFIHED